MRPWKEARKEVRRVRADRGIARGILKKSLASYTIPIPHDHQHQNPQYEKDYFIQREAIYL
jgi:hypothetical protein